MALPDVDPALVAARLGLPYPDQRIDDITTVAVQRWTAAVDEDRANLSPHVWTDGIVFYAVGRWDLGHKGGMSVDGQPVLPSYTSGSLEWAARNILGPVLRGGGVVVG